MKLVATFANNEDEMALYKQFDMSMRMAVLGMRASMVAGGATDQQVEEILSMLKYSAISSEKEATIAMEYDLEKACERLDEMDLDFDSLQSTEVEYFDKLVKTLKGEN